MKVTVNRGVELINMLQHISNCDFKQKYPDIFVGDPKYVEKLHKSFDKFINEEAVEFYKTMRNFTFSLPDTVGMCLDSNYDARDRIKWGGDGVQILLSLLPDFAKRIKFDVWFESNRKYYDSLIAEYEDFLARSNWEEFMKWFYKTDFDASGERFFNLMPSLSEMNMCTHLMKNDTPVHCCQVSVKEVDDKCNPHFAIKEVLDNAIPHTALHEFSHPIINPLTDKYFEEHEFFSIDTVGTERIGAYHNEGVFNDTIIEAVVALYLEKRELFDYRDHRIKERRQAGFYLIKPLSEFLHNYVDNMAKYNSFSEFYPKVMEFLKERVLSKRI